MWSLTIGSSTQVLAGNQGQWQQPYWGNFLIS